ncbi:MAG: DUF2334 domain-containing protein [Candidatus Omnitrophica bacterium]|nr:DUF2334 domain-containing protein [Candidatus Omnitrophota bacterium]
MKFAIRDDDTNFFTKPEELEKIYKEIWAKNIPVSLSVIPFAVKSYNSGDWDNFYQDTIQNGIGNNKELVYFLIEKLKEKKISIMLHGFSHQYKVSENKTSMPILATKENLEKLKKNRIAKKLYWYGEYTWKPYEQLKKETKEGKEYLEDLFHTKITVFVPPSNDISKHGVKAISECGLNISGTMYLSRFNRPINYYSVKNWLLKLWWRIRYNKVYPYVMDYGSHKELCAYGLVPGVSFEQLKEQFEFCFVKNAPFVLAVHYWELNSDYTLFFKNFIFFVLQEVSQRQEIEYEHVDKLY